MAVCLPRRAACARADRDFLNRAAPVADRQPVSTSRAVWRVGRRVTARRASFLHSVPTMKPPLPAWFLFAGAAALAAPVPPPDPLTLATALAAALQHNPILKVHALEARVAEARLLQAGLRSNPELALELENAFGTGALSGVKALETTLQLSQVVELSGARARRVEAATVARELTDADYELRRVEVFAEVARRFTEAAADAQRLTLARDARQLGEQTLAATEARVTAAKASPVERHKAAAALDLLQLEEEHAEHELAACRQSLAAALGATEPAFGEIRANLFALPELPAFAELASRVDQSPVLARHAVESRWHDAQARLAQSLRRSNLRLSAGLRRVEASDNVGFVAGVSLPLPVRDLTQGSVREARARQTQSEAAAEAARLETHATLFAVYQEMLHARTALAQLRESIVPAAEQSLVLVRQGYAEGRFPLTELLDAQQSLVGLRGTLVAHATTFHLHVIEIERLLGAPLVPAQP